MPLQSKVKRGINKKGKDESMLIDNLNTCAQKPERAGATFGGRKDRDEDEEEYQRNNK